MLQSKGSSTRKHVCLDVLVEMLIYKHVKWNGQKVCGYVDIDTQLRRVMIDSKCKIYVKSTEFYTTQ